MNNETLKEMTRQIMPWLIEIRRDFHMHPELGRREFRTQEKIMQYLNEMGIEHYKIAGTGLVGMIEGKEGGNVVALRADIDALPMQEKNEVSYKSQNDGVMHACGHDAHTTILLGAAKILNGMRKQFCGKVKLFFQPDEEGSGGAEVMVKEGCMDNPTVDYVLGLHVMGYLQTGQIEIRYGKLNASADSVQIIVRGKSAHGAYPEKGADAIVAAAHIITALQTLVSRNISPLNPVALSFGKISGGTAGNALAEEVAIGGTLRTLDPETRLYCKNRLEEIAEKTAAALGACVDVRVYFGYKALINNDEIVRVIEQTGAEMLGKENVVYKEFPSLGAEDFSYFLDKAKGAFYHLGCGNKSKNITAMIHNSSFDIDEDCLGVGVQMQAANALKLLSRKKNQE
ncbi:MAG TPA: M20 family metallopeptidase [Candidatus Sumerlaeota bacterium]|nr:MAG: putative hydrolase YxeP [candidate division BRC1 bacterium ADurb.Bin183]HOE63153.1 M20 family metallopeptidase [Candidatus Sumerlaeota bacterium]HRR31627.1 M20 family metallopeptidase [Candidatus Sumerlaeia bacterium]HON51534.1 M20 family metallopeptidase [Candidatus Sumerlaeota bacterium]HOR65260.1 M20 family metallopeptidase [Candidatus Sumerlaeota bacterium]